MTRILGCGGPAAVALAALLAAPVFAADAPAADSVYSSLAGRDCKTVEAGVEAAWSARECPGVGGFRLRVLFDDERWSVTVVTPDGQQFPLEFWNVVTRAFSDLGLKAEWRVPHARGKPAPTALIVRVNAHPEGAPPQSLLAVAKITPALSCVVRVIDVEPRANEAARRAADAAAAQPCLQPLP